MTVCVSVNNQAKHVRACVYVFVLFDSAVPLFLASVAVC